MRDGGRPPPASYRAALARVEEWLDGRSFDDAGLAAHISHLVASRFTSAIIAQAAATYFAKVADWPNPRGTMTADAIRIVKRDHAGRGQAKPITADQAGETADIWLVKSGVAKALANRCPDNAEMGARVFGINVQSISRRFTAAAQAVGIKGVTAGSCSPRSRPNCRQGRSNCSEWTPTAMLT